MLVDEEKLKILMRFKKCQELSAQNKDLREIIKLIYKDLELIYGRMVASEKRKRYKINFKWFNLLLNNIFTCNAKISFFSWGTYDDLLR